MPSIDVLLVEDNAGDARLIEEELRDVKETDYVAEHVETLEDGLDRLAGRSYDVVLLDLSLPDSHGIDTVVRVHERAPEVPIVVLTGLEDEELALETLKKGAQDYVVKGQFEGILDRAIRYAIERERVTREVRQLREKLAVNEKLATLGALVAGVSKELRASTEEITSTLHRVRQLTQKYVREGGDMEELTEQVNTVVGEAMDGIARIDRLGRDLRRFYRTGEDAQEPVALDELVRESVELWRTTHEPTASLELDLEAVPEIAANPAQIQQVVLNLLDNAVEAVDGSGTVAIRTREVDGEALLEIADTGPGIPEEVRERLFEPFVTTREDSDGLGLSVVKRIVDSHDGRIDVESGDDGTSISVRFRP